MRSEGNAQPYVGGGDYKGGLPIQRTPLGSTVIAGTQPRRRTGLDWSRHIAPQPEQAAVERAQRVREHHPAPRRRAERRQRKPRPPRFTPEQAQEIVDRFNAGASVRELAAAFASTAQTIGKVLHAAGCTLHRPRFSDDEVAELVEQYQQGMPLIALAHQHDSTPPTVRRVLVEAGVTIRTSREFHAHRETRRARDFADSQDRHDERLARRSLAEAEYAAGLTVPTIAAKHGWGLSAVKRYIREAAAAGRVTKRDDRAGHSGRHQRHYDPAHVDAVRRLYIDEGLSKTKVAAKLGIGPKVVDTIMRRHGIAARQRQSGYGDGAAALKAQIAARQVTNADIRAWAAENAVPCPARGVVPSAVFVAWEAAHPRPRPPESRRTGTSLSPTGRCHDCGTPVTGERRFCGSCLVARTGTR